MQMKNSIFRYEYIQKNSADWQSHLERISDFLIFEKNGGKKMISGLSFFSFVDGPKNRDQHPKVPHFRSSSISSIADELEEHWNCIVKKQICIPTHEILCCNEDEMVQYRPTSFLMHKIISDTSSSRIVPSIVIPVSIVADEEEEFEDILDFQLLQSDTLLITDFEETDMEIDNIEETSLETDNKVTPNHPLQGFKSHCSVRGYKLLLQQKLIDPPLECCEIVICWKAFIGEGVPNGCGSRKKA